MGNNSFIHGRCLGNGSPSGLTHSLSYDEADFPRLDGRNDFGERISLHRNTIASHQLASSAYITHQEGKKEKENLGNILCGFGDGQVLLT